MQAVRFSIIIALFSGSLIFADESIERGESRSATCATCHGIKGVSKNPLWPNLAGQKKNYLIKQLKDFKSGKRKDSLMSPLVQTLSDQDIEDIGAYYDSL